jgi:hypothetical protein
MTEASTHKGFAVQLWSPKVTAYLKNLGAYADIVNKDYEGEIKDKGSQVHFFSKNGLTVRDYNVDATGFSEITTEQPSGDKKTLTVDQQKYIAFEIEDIDKVQASVKLVDEWTQTMASSFADEKDAHIHGKAIAGAATKLHNDSALQITKDNVWAEVCALQRVLTRKKALTKAGLDYSGKRPALVITPEFQEILLQCSNYFANAFGDNVLRKGQVGHIGVFDVFVDTNIQTDKSGTGTAATYSQKIVAMTSQAITFADQITETETYRSQKTFKDVVRSLMTYGCAVANPDCIVTSKITMSGLGA